jgi:bacterial/archaeal transporter family-2 protein
MQVAVMGKFGERVGSLEAFAFAALLTAAIAIAALLVARRSLAGIADAVDSPRWLWLGGVFGAFVVLTITVTAPRLGVAAVVALLIAGQLAMGALIDRFGWFGVEQVPLHWPRIVGVLLLAVGALLALRKA